MGPQNQFMISVMTDWNDWRSAGARLCDLRDVHWHQPTGAPHPLIHAYLSCDSIVSGELSHRCDRVSAPHRIRVCVLRSHNIPSVYDELVRRAATTTSSLGAMQTVLHIAPRSRATFRRVTR